MHGRLFVGTLSVLRLALRSYRTQQLETTNQNISCESIKLVVKQQANCVMELLLPCDRHAKAVD